MWVYFWAVYSVPLIYVSVFRLTQYCFDNYSLNQGVWCLQLCSSQYCFCGSTQILVLFCFCVKCHWNFDRNCAKSVNWFVDLWSVDMFTIILNPCSQNIFIYVFYFLINILWSFMVYNFMKLKWINLWTSYNAAVVPIV